MSSASSRWRSGWDSLLPGFCAGGKR